MTTTRPKGRLGNQIIRNIAVSLVAEKYNLRAKYCSEQLINNLGIKLFSGNMSFRRTIR